MFLLIRLLVLWGINVLALIVVDWLFDGVQIDRWWPLLLGAFVLMVGNAILKPILAIVTLPLVIITLGLSYFAINVLMLALAEWVAPRLLDRRVLDVRRRDDRGLARERRRRSGAQPCSRLVTESRES